MQIKAANENAVVCNANSSVEIYYDNTKKFETSGDGAKIIGKLIPTSDPMQEGMLFKDSNGFVKVSSG